jgi:ribosomal protein S18 acetylase RimI-like enzyme
MIFNSVKEEDTAIIQAIYQSYCQSFPEDERRGEKQFQNLWHNPITQIYSITIDDGMIGYLITWELNDGVFIEHFEVFSEFRNKKYGSEILYEFSKIHPKLVLESEPSDLNELAKRRIAFYERNQFSIIDKQYIQPAYDCHKKSLPLYLLSSFEVENITELSKEIHEKVYNFHNPLS